MSFIGRLFGTAAATKEVVSAVRDGLDALVYTKEERSQDEMKDYSEARSMLVEWVKNSQGQNLARRVIALSITFSWLLMKFLGLVIAGSAVWVDNVASTSEKLLALTELVKEFGGDMTPAVMLILGFYYAAPHMGKIAEAALVQFGKRN